MALLANRGVMSQESVDLDPSQYSLTSFDPDHDEDREEYDPSDEEDSAVSKRQSTDSFSSYRRSYDSKRRSGDFDEELRKEVEKLKVSLEDCKKTCDEKDQQIAERDKIIVERDIALSERNKTIEKLRVDLEDATLRKDATPDISNSKDRESDEEFNVLQEQNRKSQQEVERLKSELLQLQAELRDAEVQRVEMHQQLTTAQSEVQELKAARNKDLAALKQCQQKLQRAEEDAAFFEEQLKAIAQSEGGAPSASAPEGAAATENPDGAAASVADAEGEQAQRSVGLGFTFKRDSKTGNWQVNRIKPGGFAEQHGDIATGDVIVSVDQRAVKGLSQQDLGVLVMGPEGSEAVLVLHKPDGRELRIRARRIKSK